MKKLGIVIFIAALAIGLLITNLFSFGRVTTNVFNLAFDVGTVTGSGNMASDVRPVEGFTSVDVGGVFEVEITTQKDFELEIEADENLLPFINTDVVNGTLKIETEKRLHTSNPMRIRISAPDIEQLDVSGAAKITIKDLNNDALALDASGSSEITVKGETARLSVDVSGSSRIRANDLKAVKARVDASGSSQVGLNVSGDLDAEASGASKIFYSGTPTNVKEKTTGSSRISPQ